MTWSVEPYLFFIRRAPAATPRMRPEVRPRKRTGRSASPSGKVFRMMASVSRAGIRSRRADSRAQGEPQPRKMRSKAELKYLPQQRKQRNDSGGFFLRKIARV